MAVGSAARRWRGLLRLTLFSAVCVVWLALAPDALAVTFTVNSTADAPDANTNDGACATAGGVCTLRAAIQQANALPAPPVGAPHIVNLPVGTITLTIPGRDETNSATGDLNVKVTTGGLQIIGQGATQTIIEAGTSSTTGIDRVIRVQPGGALKLTKVTIQHGTAGQSGQPRSGGGILNEGQLDVVEVEVRESRANNDPSQSGGGGIANASGAVLLVSRSAIVGNSVVRNGGGIANQGNATIETSTIAENDGGGAVGGVFDFNAPQTIVRSATLVGNHAPAPTGGGLGAFPGSPPFTIGSTILDSPSGGNCSNTTTLTSELFNLSTDGTCPFPTVDHDFATDRSNQPSGLSTRGLHGGETSNYVPLTTSGALDRGIRTGTCVSGQGFDQRGLSRPQALGVAGPCDIGSVEVPGFVVLETGDGVPAPLASSPCRSGSRFGCDLRQAIVDANALGGASIMLPSTTFTMTQAGRNEDAGLTGDLDIHAIITIASAGPNGTTLRAGTSTANGLDRLFDVHPDGQLTLRDVTLQFGHAVGAGSAAGDGGAIRAAEHVELSNVIVRDSTADNDGGGIAISAGERLSLENTEIRDNTAGRNGGGISAVVSVEATQATIAGNRAGGVGGGLQFNNQSQAAGTPFLSLIVSTISSNQASVIGGIGLTSRTGTTVTLLRVSVVDNINTSQIGAAVSLTGGTVKVKGALFARSSVANCATSGATVSGGLNLSDDATCDFGSSNRLSTIPLVGQIRDNGAVLRTNALLPGGPAIDVIPESDPDRACTTSISLGDGRGVQRTSGNGVTGSLGFAFDSIADGDDVAGRACDIGAFEVQRIFVQTTSDTLSAGETHGLCTPDSSVQCSLRAAIRAANAQGHAVVVLPAGTFTLTRIGSNEDAASTGDLDITGGVTLLGASAASSIVQAGPDQGAGIDRVFHVLPGGSAIMRRLSIANGHVINNGAGILNQGDLDMADVEMFHNLSENQGGAISVQTSGSTTLRWMDIAGNGASINSASGGGGGGIFVEQGRVTLENVTLAFNRGHQGGGILVEGGTPIVTNVSLVDNQADAGQTAGIHIVGGSFTVSNTLFRNTGADCGGIAPRIISLGHNLSHDATCATPFSFTANDGDALNATVALGPHQNNGGQTETYALLPPVGHPIPGNPAIDGGSLETPLDGRNGRCAATDQRNQPRPRDGDGNIKAVCDVGAFEVAGTIGTAEVQVAPNPAQPGQPVIASFTWTVPAPSVWRDLESLSLKLLAPNGQSVFFLQWTEATDRYTLLDADGHELTGGNPGSGTVLQTSLVSLSLRDVRTTGSGPTGQSVTLTLPFVFGAGAAGQTFSIEVAARSDAGVDEPFAPAGTIQISNPGSVVQQLPDVKPDQPDQADNPRQESEDERPGRKHRDRGDEGDHHVEGNVVATDPGATPPTVTIANRDGLVELRLHGDAVRVTVQPGDYVSAEGEKINEQLYEIDDLAVD